MITYPNALFCARVSHCRKDHFDRIIAPIEAVAKESRRRSAENASAFSGKGKHIAASVSTESVEKLQPQLSDLEFIPNGLLGVGSFGRVSLVQSNGTTYALKAMEINTIVAMRQKSNVINERRCLLDVRGLPFIPRLHATYLDSCCLYMLQDVMLGGELFSILEAPLPVDRAAFYAAQVLIVLENLHQRDYVYRDLKPENILLCSDGHLKLTDFGLSRFFETRPPNPEDMIGEDADVVTRSFCGTEQYMSPEMLLQQGHNFRMDWWCLGLLMHEMLSAKHPFHGPSHYETLKNMVTKQPTIDQRVSHNAAAVVRSLLIKNPRSRMCCQKGCDELKSLAFFADINWEDLYNKNISLSHIPNVKDETDISFFETTFTREAPVDSLASEASIKKPAEKKKTGGLLSYFMGTSSKKEEREKSVNDSFRDFGFVKQATEAEASNGNGEEEEALGLGEMSSPTRDSPPGGSSFTPSVPIKSKK